MEKMWYCNCTAFSFQAKKIDLSPVGVLNMLPTAHFCIRIWTSSFNNLLRIYLRSWSCLNSNWTCLWVSTPTKNTKENFCSVRKLQFWDQKWSKNYLCLAPLEKCTLTLRKICSMPQLKKGTYSFSDNEVLQRLKTRA